MANTLTGKIGNDSSFGGADKDTMACTLVLPGSGIMDFMAAIKARPAWNRSKQPFIQVNRKNHVIDNAQ